MIYSLFKEEEHSMSKPEILEYSAEHVSQENVDAHADAEQNIVWENIFNFVNEKVEASISTALELKITDEEYLQNELRQLVIATYEAARSYPESRSISSELLIMYVAKAFEYNELMFQEIGVTNILKAAEVI